MLWIIAANNEVGRENLCYERIRLTDVYSQRFCINILLPWSTVKLYVNIHVLAVSLWALYVFFQTVVSHITVSPDLGYVRRISTVS